MSVPHCCALCTLRPLLQTVCLDDCIQIHGMKTSIQADYMCTHTHTHYISLLSSSSVFLTNAEDLKPSFSHHCSRPSHLAFNKIRNISVSYFLKIKFRNDNISPPNRLKMQELSEPSLNPLSVLTFTHPAPMTMLSPCFSHLVFPYLPCFHSANHCHVNRMAQSSFPLS